MQAINLCQKYILNNRDLLVAPANCLLKIKKEFKHLIKKGDTSYIYKNELDRACFQHDVAYGDFKGLAKRTAADKVLRDKAFKIASDQKYDGYQRGLASMVLLIIIKIYN